MRQPTFGATACAALAVLITVPAPAMRVASAGVLADTAKPTLPLEPARWARFTTSKGTWISLDVSPDGQTIVLDLLGDLYTLPIAGGRAKRLTLGLAYDMQARWSPDGKRIAFTTDRGGTENVWIMGADGSRPRPVSREADRTTNSAAWSPDGEWLVTRRRLTDK
ncbi:MAG: TolB family protein, partial [Gemmatimonadales bacterium]